ncbi:MAG: hypothetical protein HZB33_06810 [Nitrospirae bacterium]|nr:hypothetical protein [Nitrospirota bacterium]
MCRYYIIKTASRVAYDNNWPFNRAAGRFIDGLEGSLKKKQENKRPEAGTIMPGRAAD